MRIIIEIFFAIILICKTSSGQHYVQNNHDLVQIAGYIHDKNQIDSISLLKISLKFDYQLLFKSDRTGITILDTIRFGMLNTLKLWDLNNDGYKDIIVTTDDNRLKNYIYLFDPTTHSNFISLKSKDINGDLKRCENSPLFYTYKRIGCADNHWKSNLIKFQMQGFIIKGEINANLCGVTKDHNIQINNKNPGNENTVKVFSKTEFNQLYTNKFDFIKSYWSNNWQRFK